MELLISILSCIFIIYGIGLFFAQGSGAFIASIVCLGSGVYAYDTKSFTPLIIGFALLWVLRLAGFEKHVGSVSQSLSESNKSIKSSAKPRLDNTTATPSEKTNIDWYVIGFIAILICLVLFAITLSAKPKILPSDAPAPPIGASTNLPAVSTLSDAKDSVELVTQAADKPPEAKEQTSNASSKQGGLGLATSEVLVTGSSGVSTSFSPAQEAWLGNADRTDPAILRRMRSAVPDR